MNEVKLSKLAEDGILSEYCHDSTFKVCKTLKDSFAHTMLCKQSFIGQYYHSVTMHNNKCIDLNYNCVMPFELYIDLAKAQTIQKISHNNILEYTQPFQSSKLLFATLDRQLKDQHIQKKLKLTD